MRIRPLQPSYASCFRGMSFSVCSVSFHTPVSKFIFKVSLIGPILLGLLLYLLLIGVFRSLTFHVIINVEFYYLLFVFYLPPFGFCSYVPLLSLCFFVFCFFWFIKIALSISFYLDFSAIFLYIFF